MNYYFNVLISSTGKLVISAIKLISMFFFNIALAISNLDSFEPSSMPSLRASYLASLISDLT